MIQGITARLIGLSSYHMQIVADSRQLTAEVPLESLQALSDEVSKIEGGVSASPERQGIALAAGKNGRVGATVRAVSPLLWTQSPTFSGLFTVIEGSASLSTPRSALIGSKIASDLGLSAGDTIRIISMRKGPTGMPLPLTTPFTVEGIVSSGYQELDARWVFIPVEAGFALMNGDASRTIIGVETEDAFSAQFQTVRRHIDALLKAFDSSFFLITWDRFNQAQFENFASTKTMLMFVMFLIVLVAVVNVSSSLVILVIERRREIAILKSLGATSEGVAFAFLLTGMFTGVCGVALGIPLGLLAAVNVNGIIGVIERVVNTAARFVFVLAGGTGEFLPVHLLDPAYYLDRIPVVIPFGSLLLIGVGTLALSVLVSVLPARRAGGERPIWTLQTQRG
jgi:lipoprotein-releasing system permease protein